jgi:hypothetical protein
MYPHTIPILVITIRMISVLKKIFMAVFVSFILLSKTKKVAIAIKVTIAISRPRKSPLLAFSQSIDVAPAGTELVRDVWLGHLCITRFPMY